MMTNDATTKVTSSPPPITSLPLAAAALVPPRYRAHSVLLWRRHEEEVRVTESPDPDTNPAMSDAADALERFLRQPPEHGFDDVEEPATPAPPLSRRERLHRFFFDKQPGAYSSIAPRRSDGTRTKIFFFNGNGRGR